MLWVGGGVTVLPLSVVLVMVLVRAPPGELWVLALWGVVGDALVDGGVLTFGAGPRHSWQRFPWALLAGVLALASLVSLLPMVSYRVVSPWWLSLTLKVAVGEVALSVVPLVMPVVRSLRALLWFAAPLM